MTEPQPNKTERDLAYDLERRADRNGIAYALAEAREGATLEGPRSVITGHAELARVIYTGPDRERALELVTEHAWRSWFGELRRRQARPCGWPTAQRTYLGHPQIVAGEHTFVEFDEDGPEVDRLMISVSCEVVPIA